jgi:hypothetical protein
MHSNLYGGDCPYLKDFYVTDFRYPTVNRMIENNGDMISINETVVFLLYLYNYRRGKP